MMSSDVSLSMSRVDLEVEENFAPSPKLSLRIHLHSSKFYFTGSNYLPFFSDIMFGYLTDIFCVLI